MLGQMLQNFRDTMPQPPTKLPVDYDHLSMDPQRPGDGKAAGWFVDLDLRDDGNELWGLIEWTPDAASAIQKKEYQFVSPSFARNYTDKQGNKIGTTLLAAAITNHPFLEGMAPLTLSATDELAVELINVSAQSVHVNQEVEMADTTKGDMNQGKDDVTKPAAGAKDSKVYTFKDVNGKPVSVDQDQVNNAVKAAGAKSGKVSMSDDPQELVSLREQLDSTRSRLDEQRSEILELRNGRESDRKARLIDQAEMKFSSLVAQGKATPAEKARALKLAQRDVDASTAGTEKIWDLFADWCDDHKAVVIKLHRTHGSDELSADGNTAGDPEDQLLALAEAKQKADPKLTAADAIALVAHENPDLYQAANDVTTLTNFSRQSSRDE